MPRRTEDDSRASTRYGTDARIFNQTVQFLRNCVRWDESRKHEYSLRSLTLYPPTSTRNGKWLVVAKRGITTGREVLFVQSSSPLAALVAALGHVAAGTGEWKADQYAKNIMEGGYS